MLTIAELLDVETDLSRLADDLTLIENVLGPAGDSEIVEGIVTAGDSLSDALAELSFKINDLHRAAR
jgi:hypothetical protein